MAELRRREELARRMGGPEKVERQHAGGKLTVRERIDALSDPGRSHEICALAGVATHEGAELAAPLRQPGPTARGLRP